MREGRTLTPAEGSLPPAETAVKRLIDLAETDDLPSSMLETPGRVVRAFREMLHGYREDPAAILSTTEEERGDGLVVVTGIVFTSLCAHHLLPFSGTAAVGYVPAGRVVGLSKFSRLVTCRSCRFQLQERLTREIAEDVARHLAPAGVGVVITAEHSCMSCRGVRQTGARTTTSAWRGSLRDADRQKEFLRYLEQ